MVSFLSTHPTNKQEYEAFSISLHAHLQDFFFLTKIYWKDLPVSSLFLAFTNIPVVTVWNKNEGRVTSHAQANNPTCIHSQNLEKRNEFIIWHFLFNINYLPYFRKAMYTLRKVFWHCFLNTPVKTHTSITLMSPSSSQPTGRLFGDPRYLTQQITFHTLHWGSALMSNWKFVLNDQGSSLCLKPFHLVPIYIQIKNGNPSTVLTKAWK